MTGTDASRQESGFAVITKRFLDRVEAWLDGARSFNDSLKANAWTETDLDPIVMQMHKFAGSARTFGFEDLNDAAREAEEALLELQFAPCNPSRERAIQAMDRFFVEAEVATRGPTTPSGAEAARAEAGEDRAEPAPGAPDKYHVFIVCGEDEVRDLVDRSLAGSGVRISSGVTGDQAMDRLDALAKRAEEDHPDLLILDVDMPGARGVDILSFVKTQTGLGDVPVLMLTRRDADETVSSGLPVGAPDCVVMPSDVADLRERVLGTLERRSKTILVVDDDHLLSELLQSRLHQAGFTVHTAEHGLLALERIRTLRPDLVILDVMMPGLDGISVLRQVKEEPALADIPILMLSRKTGAVAIGTSFEIGAHDYVTKPFDLEDLVARAKGILRRGERDHRASPPR